MRILVTGGKGQLGRCLMNALPDNGQVICLDRHQLDITDRQQVQSQVAALNIDVIVNAAAYTRVDQAESDRAAAESTNIVGPANLAAAAEQLSIPLIHISTDYVFSGNPASVPFDESTLTDPINVYGETKLLGEQAAMAACSRVVIIRTSWLFSEYGNTFVHTMLKLGQIRDSLSVINDQFGCPTYAGDLARCIFTLIQQGIHQSSLYHFGGDRRVSWYAFATEIFSLAKALDESYCALTLSPIASEQYPCAANRPKDSTLNCQKIDRERGIACSNWRHGLKKAVPLILSQMKK